MTPLGQKGIAPAPAVGDVLEALSDGIAVFDPDAYLLQCNARFRTLNPAFADLIVPGTAWEILVREAEARGVIDGPERSRLLWMEDRLAAGDTVPPLALDLPGGRAHEITLRATPAGGFLMIQSDVTERKQAADSERQAEQLLSKVLEACPAPVIMARIGDGQVLYRSPEATELFGTSRVFHDCFASREQLADFITAILPDGRVDDLPIVGRRADGTTFPAALSGRLIDYHGEDVVVSSTLDLTQKVALQRTLAEQREALYQSEKMSALGELLAGVAHELNNPLSVVVGHALMLKEEEREPSTARRIEKISDAAERCARIVKSFLAMARQQPAVLAPTTLSDVVDTALDALAHGATQTATDIAVDLAPDLPPIDADADQLAQVIINLVTNAEQAMAEARAGDQVRIAARASADLVTLTVADNGPGVPEGIRGRIFDPMFTTKEVGQGTGIGLAFVHRVVIGHGGSVQLDPADGPGASFTIRLPVAERQGEKPDHAPAPKVATGGSRVLVIDDEDDVADMIREILVRDGFTVDHARSAETAMILLRDYPYSLVLSDLNMPGIGGQGLYELVERDLPDVIPRLGFVTGDTMSPAARGFLEEAGRPFLEKPIAPAELRALTHRMLDQIEETA